MKRIFHSIIFLLVTLISSAQPGWKLSIQTWTFHKHSFLEAVEKAKQLGLKYMEAYPGQQVGKGYKGAFSFNLNARERARLKTYLKEKGIKLIAWGVVDKNYYHSRANIENFFIFCHDMDIPFITAEPEWEDLDEFNRLAEKYNVKVALHCHPRPGSHYWNPDSMLFAMKGRKNIGAWPDLGHWTKSGIQPVDGLKKLEGKIWGLHFKDVKEFNNVNAEDTLFGKGAADLAGVLKELKRQKFKGVLSMEYEANEDNNMDDMRKNKLFYEAEVRKLSQ
jgi:sugar phosphate isomerase/epimerase